MRDLEEIRRELLRLKDRINLGVQSHEIVEINIRLVALEYAVREIRAEIDGILSWQKRHETIATGKHGLE